MADPYKALAGYFELPDGDKRIYAVAKRLIDQGIDPAEWVNAQHGGPMPTKNTIGPVDPRGMRVDRRQENTNIGGAEGDPDPITGEKPRHYNPREDEILGLDEGPDRPPWLTRASTAVVSTATNPKKRREFERGISDTMTFGLAENVAKKLAPLFGDESFGEQQAEEDAREADGYRDVGRIAGAVAPAGLTNYVGRQAASGIARAAALGKGPVLGTGIGLAAGAASAPVVSGVVEAGRTAMEAPFNSDVGVVDIPRAAWEAAKGTATDPAAMTLSAVAGGLGGLGRGIRESDSQTGRDMRLVDEFGGKPSITRGAKGGAFDDPALRGRKGTTRDVANIAEESADSIRSGLRRQAEDLSADYGTRKAGIAGQGGFVDITDEVTGAVDDITSKMRLPKDTRDKLVKRVMAEMGDDPLVQPLWNRQQGRMMATPDELHELRQKWDFIAKTGEPGEDAIARTVAERLRAVENRTGYGQLNEDYAAGIERIKRGHELLGMGTKKKTKAGDVRANTKAARRLRRGGDNTATAGHDDPSMRQFAEEFPEFEAQLAAPELLAAKGRLTPSILPEGGGLYDKLSGVVTRNIEPLEAGVISPLGTMAGKGAGLVAPLRNPVEQLYEDWKRRNEERAQLMRGLR